MCRATEGANERRSHYQNASPGSEICGDDLIEAAEGLGIAAGVAEKDTAVAVEKDQRRKAVDLEKVAGRTRFVGGARQHRVFDSQVVGDTTGLCERGRAVAAFTGEADDL